MRRLIIAFSLFAVLLAGGSMILPYKILDGDQPFGLFQSMMEELIKENTHSGIDLVYPLLSPILCFIAFLLLLFPAVKRFWAFIPAILNLLFLGVVYVFAIRSDKQLLLFEFDYVPGIGFYTCFIAAGVLLIITILHWIFFREKKRKRRIHADLLDG